MKNVINLKKVLNEKQSDIILNELVSYLECLEFDYWYDEEFKTYIIKDDYTSVLSVFDFANALDKIEKENYLLSVEEASVLIFQLHNKFDELYDTNYFDELDGVEYYMEDINEIIELLEELVSKYYIIEELK